MSRLLALLALSAVMPVPARAEPAGAPDEGRSAGLQQITHGPTINAMPHWSPDGRRIVFHSRRQAELKTGLATRKIWVMSTDGSDAHAISGGPADEYHPAFSPVDQRILFVSEANGSRDLWIMASEEGPPIPLTDDPGVEDHPAWSPDGERIVYTAFPKDGGNFDLWIVNSDGSGKHRLTTTAANELFPVWHPEGDTIAYVGDAGGNFDIYGIRVRDQTIFPIIVSPDQDVRPAWSPDGTKIAFARWPSRGRTDDSTLWIANFDGTVPIDVEVPVGSTHPAWAPDGRVIAFQHRTESGWDIWTYALPPDLAHGQRLRLAQQLRTGTSDLVVLRSGDRLAGTVRNARYAVRTPYGTLDFPRAVVAGLRFPAGRSLARVMLANGDSVSGILIDDTIRVTTDAGERSLGCEMLESVGLRLGDRVPQAAPGLRLTMQNGDVLTAHLGPRPLRLRVAGQTIDIAPTAIAYADISEDGTRLHAELRSGETVAGELIIGKIDLRLAAGPGISVRPSQIRSLVGSRRPARGAGPRPSQ